VTPARRMEPEWLDAMAQDDPRGMRSRRDLARLNAIMSHARWIAAPLREARPVRIAEIGAGDGGFALRLAAALPAPSSGAELVLLDRAAAPSEGTVSDIAACGWPARPVRADVFDWLSDPATPRFDAIVANLFLHHFDDERLAGLLELAGNRTDLFVACEPRRSNLALASSRLVGLLGCNDVTRHDAVASVRAGFSGDEISRLWRARGWILEETPCGLFSHRFVARRHAAV